MNKKIFISHSSKDKEIVDQFVDKILHLGLAILPNDIAYTSREETGVIAGFDIQNFIKTNIKGCDFVFFMISSNYKKSEICLNEMGAAWALDKRIIPIVFPDVDFESIGWLLIAKKGFKLNDASAYDSICEEITDYYKTSIKLSAWNRNKEDFIKYINDKIVCRQRKEESRTLFIQESELDILDCKEQFDNNIATTTTSIQIISSALHEYAHNLNKKTEQLRLLNPKKPNITHIRGIMLGITKIMDTLSDVFDTQTPNIEISFDQAVRYALLMRDMSQRNHEQAKEERQSIQELIDTMLEATDSTDELIKSMLNPINLDKNQKRSQDRLRICMENYKCMTNKLISRANDLLKA